MATLSEDASAPQFPMWPMNYLSCYRHLADDYSRYVKALSAATDPAQAARAEGDYGMRVMNDLMQAWYDLALSPYTALVKAAAETAQAAPKTH